MKHCLALCFCLHSHLETKQNLAFFLHQKMLLLHGNLMPFPKEVFHGQREYKHASNYTWRKPADKCHISRAGGWTTERSQQGKDAHPPSSSSSLPPRRARYSWALCQINWHSWLMDKQLTSVCNDYLQGTTAGLHNSGFFFSKAKAVFTAGTGKSWCKAGSKLRRTWVSPSKKIPHIDIRAKFWGWEGKCDRPVVLWAAPQIWAVAMLPVTAGCYRARGHGANPALGREDGTGVSWRDRTPLWKLCHPHPSESFAKLLYRALLSARVSTRTLSAFPWPRWRMPGLICNRLGANRHHAQISRI